MTPDELMRCDDPRELHTEISRLRAEAASLRQGVETLRLGLEESLAFHNCPAGTRALRETEGLVTGPYFTKAAESKIPPGQVEESKTATNQLPVSSQSSSYYDWKNLAQTAAAALWDVRAFLKQSDESPAAVERITDDLERLTRMREVIEPAGALERPEE